MISFSCEFKFFEGPSFWVLPKLDVRNVIWTLDLFTMDVSTPSELHMCMPSTDGLKATHFEKI